MTQWTIGASKGAGRQPLPDAPCRDTRSAARVMKQRREN